MATDQKRRRLLAAAGTALLLQTPAAALAERLLATPRQSTGPFYPDTKPTDQDNNLLRIGEAGETAGGAPTRISGRILDVNGSAITGVRVEIWQCDANGRYHHSRDQRNVDADPWFQGYGHADSDETGGYAFRTIRPVAYPGRTPHIHFRVLGAGVEPFTTQMYLEDEPQNAEDFLYQRLSPAERERVTIKLKPGENAAWRGQFNIVLA